MVQGTHGPQPSRYGPLQLWSSTYNMGHIVTLGVDIGVGICYGEEVCIRGRD